jgi:predicted nuclease of restriction endonuclease-like (RecB) superfamily
MSTRNHLEEALIRELEHFLLELGNDFSLIARHRRLRVGNEWYRVDLLFLPQAASVPDRD